MKELKTINIKGKDYVQVNDRLKAFRTEPQYAGWSLVSDIKELTDTSCTVLASIIDQDGKVRATGLAREVVAKSPINKFAFVENCETSAWGRALGNLGIGIDTAICTAEELIQKMSQDEKTPAQKAAETKAKNKLSKEEALQKYKDIVEYFTNTPEPPAEALVRAESVQKALEWWKCDDEARDLSERIGSYDRMPAFA